MVAPDSHSTRISSAQDMVEYFQDLVREALKNQEIEANDLIEFYIVHLLSQYTRTDQITPTSGGSLWKEPLAIQFLTALQEELGESIRRFKELGDFSLFISGFYPESLQRKAVDPNYYISLGCRAYRNVALLTRNRALYADLYSDLSTHFGNYVDVLSEVSEKSHISSNLDAVRIYERWLKTRSQRDARLLQKLGIAPAGPGRESQFVQ